MPVATVRTAGHAQITTLFMQIGLLIGRQGTRDTILLLLPTPQQVSNFVLLFTPHIMSTYEYICQCAGRCSSCSTTSCAGELKQETEESTARYAGSAIHGHHCRTCRPGGCYVARRLVCLLSQTTAYIQACCYKYCGCRHKTGIVCMISHKTQQGSMWWQKQSKQLSHYCFVTYRPISNGFIPLWP